MARACVAACMALLACSLDAQQPDLIFKELNSNNAPGAAVLALQNGRVLFERGYGLANLTTGERTTPVTNFRLASVTKQFTAMAVMLLVHDGKLRYDEKLTDVFPDFPRYGDAIRMRNLLNHTSGLQDYEDLMDQHHWDASRQISDAGVLGLLKQTSGTKFPPGTRFEYSNSGYVLLGLVVQKVSGEPFGAFLHDRIFRPLGMTGTLAYEKGKNEVPHRAYGYTQEAGAWKETDQSPTSATLGDGGVYSSVVDLAKWFSALDSFRLLSRAEMAPAWTPVPPDTAVAMDGVTAGYGFGWAIDAMDGFRRMWHYGETVGFRTNVQRFPERRLSVVVLENRTEPNPGELAARLARVYVVRPAGGQQASPASAR